MTPQPHEPSRLTSQPSNRSPSTDTAEVIAHPPVIYLVAILIALGLNWLWPMPLIKHPVSSILGISLVGVALTLFTFSVLQFIKAGTPIPTNRPAIALVHTGPYRFTRNPIYTAFSLFQIGLAFWINTPWLLITLLPAWLLIHFGVVLREERYLDARLGEQYVQYKATVRRWFF